MSKRWAGSSQHSPEQEEASERGVGKRRSSRRAEDDGEARSCQRESTFLKQGNKGENSDLFLQLRAKHGLRTQSGSS